MISYYVSSYLNLLKSRVAGIELRRLRSLAFLFLILISLLLFLSNGFCRTIENDIGDKDDFYSDREDIYLVYDWRAWSVYGGEAYYKEESEGITGAYLENLDLEDMEGFSPYHFKTHNPKYQDEDWIDMRYITGYELGYGLFYAKVSGSDAAFDPNYPLYLTIRYKDTNINPALDRFSGSQGDKFGGASVRCWNGVNWVRLGYLGGMCDYKWKTKTFKIEPGQVVASESVFKFNIGTGSYSNSDIYGDIYVDWIKLSDVSCQPLNEDFDVREGFYPKASANPNFSGFKDTGFLIKDKETGRRDIPFFPIGIVAPGNYDFYWASDEDNYLLNVAQLGFNFVTYQDWDSYVRSGSKYWGDMDVRGYTGLTGDLTQRYLGLENFLDYANQYGLKVVPWIASDVMQPWIVKSGLEYWTWPDPRDLWDYAVGYFYYDGTYAGIMKTWEHTVNTYKDDPGILMWFIKDEADHPAIDWGTPVEGVAWAYKITQAADPEHPCWVNLMGWRSQFARIYKDTADVLSLDKYTGVLDPLDHPDDSVEHDHVAEFIEEFRYETDNEKMLMNIILTESCRDSDGSIYFKNMEDIEAATYMAITHGTQGLLYFNDPGFYWKDEYKGWWREFGDLISEVNYLSLRVLHNSKAQTLGCAWGKSHAGAYPLNAKDEGDLVVANDNNQIHALLRQNLETADRYLIAINGYKEDANGVTFTLAGLLAGTEIEVLFEDRTIIVDDNFFTDNFGRYQRHVYLIPASSVGIDVTAPEIINLSITDGEIMFSSPIIIEGDVVDESPCEVTINGQQATIDDKGHFSIEVALQYVANLFKVEAVDLAGNKAQRIIGVFYRSFGVDEINPSLTEPSMDITGSWHPAGEGLPWISPLVKDTYSDYQKVSYDVDIPEGIDYLLIPTIWYEKSEAASEAGNYYLAVSMGGIRRTQTFSLSKGLNKPNPLTLNVSSLSGKQTLTFEWKKQPAASSDVKIIIKRIFFKEIASGEGSLKSSR